MSCEISLCFIFTTSHFRRWGGRPTLGVNSIGHEKIEKSGFARSLKFVIIKDFSKNSLVLSKGEIQKLFFKIYVIRIPNFIWHFQKNYVTVKMATSVQSRNFFCVSLMFTKKLFFDKKAYFLTNFVWFWIKSIRWS